MKIQLFFLYVAAVLSVIIPHVIGAKILALLTLPTRSHHIWNRELMIALAKRGHDVTVISCDVDKESVANLTYIHLEGCYEFLTSQLSTIEELNLEGEIQKIRATNQWTVFISEYMLSKDGAKQLLNYPDGKIFDLIITESEYNYCFLPFIWKFGYPPVVGVNGAGIPRRANFITGTPKNPAYTPDYFSSYSDKMTFMQRTHSFFIDVASLYMWKFEYLPILQDIASKHFGQEVPSLEELEKNISLVLSNTVFGYHHPRPITPNVIPVGGMHLKPARPLEQRLQKFLDDAKDGAIFFSLGTNLRSDMLPSNVQQAFLEAFADLPQRVLWKFESDKSLNVPKNVLLETWLPQRDILGHKNVKLFITHNGLMSSLEAEYFGVPTLGIPFFMDQHSNMERARELQTGIGLSFKSLNKETILSGIQEVLTNPKYAENANRMSAVFRDQPQHPLDRAVFWTEYVLRHGGAPHLRSAAVDMPLYSYLLLDLLAAVVAVLVVAVLVLVTVTRWLWRRLASAARPRATSLKAKTK